MTSKVKYQTRLLTGEVVNELTDSVALKQVSTHCPRKWALVDLQSGQIYGWREDGTGYVAMPAKAEQVLRRAVKDMQPKKRRRKAS